MEGALGEFSAYVHFEPHSPLYGGALAFTKWLFLQLKGVPFDNIFLKENRLIFSKSFLVRFELIRAVLRCLSGFCLTLKFVSSAF